MEHIHPVFKHTHTLTHARTQMLTGQQMFPPAVNTQQNRSGQHTMFSRSSLLASAQILLQKRKSTLYKGHSNPDGSSGFF